jgi:hypothetical protein
MKKFVSVEKIMSRRRRNRRRPKLASKRSAPFKTLPAAASQTGLDDTAGKLEKIADQTSAAADGTAHFELMARKWRDDKELSRADWEKAERKDQRRFIVEALRYRLKPKDHGSAGKHA